MQMLKYCSGTGFLIALLLAFIGINIFVLAPIQTQLMALSGGVGVIDLLPWYTSEEALQRFNLYGVEGRNLYLTAEWTGDLIYPVVYSLLFGATLYRLGGRKWALLSVYSCFVDWIENIFISIMLYQYPSFNIWVAHIATVLTALKWSMAFCNVMMIIVFSILKLRDMMRNQHNERVGFQ